jgi:hypothetical protein
MGSTQQLLCLLQRVSVENRDYVTFWQSTSHCRVEGGRDCSVEMADLGIDIHSRGRFLGGRRQLLFRFSGHGLLRNIPRHETGAF